MTKDLTTVGEGRELNLADPKVAETIRATVAVGASDAELAMFLEFVKSTGLNPFKKELWFIKAGGRPQMMTGINGFLQIANSHPQFDGMTVEVDDDENPRKAVCKVYRKDRRIPAEGVALLKEYRKDTPIWRQMPRVMLTKVAKSIALREAFPQQLAGLYTAEEMPAEYSQPAAPTAPSVHPAVKSADSLPAPKRTAHGKWYYDLSKLPEEKRADAQEYAELEGALLDLETGLWVADRALKLLKNAQVPAPRPAEPIAEDDIPDAWKEGPEKTAAA